MKKWGIALVFFILVIILEFWSGLNVAVVNVLFWVFLTLSIGFSIYSLVKKENKRAISILIIIFSVLIIIIFLGSYLILSLVKPSPFSSALLASQEHEIAPSISNYYYNENIVELGFFNLGEKISLSLDKAWIENCDNPKVSAKEAIDSMFVPIMTREFDIEKDEIFSFVFDCENEVSEGDVFRGEVSFDYMRDNKENTFSTISYGTYDDVKFQ